MKYALLCFLFLTACSIPESEKLADSARSDLKAVESVLNNLQDNLTTECRKSLENDLNSVSVRFKDIDEKISSSVSACELEKSVLKGQIRNRSLFICILIIIIVFGLFFKIKTSI